MPRLPERYSRYCFSAEKGVGRAFLEFLVICSGRAGECSVSEQNHLFAQAVNLLALVLEQDEQVLGSHQSHIKTAHLARIERYITAHLGDPLLSPETIAGACGISVRYLHKLFSDTGYSVSEWVRVRRLEAAHRELKQAPEGVHIGEIAYRCGFSDHARFSRLFRQHYGYAPSELRHAPARKPLRTADGVL